jgi:predicted amidohydrolase
LQQPVQARFFGDESILLDPQGLVVWRYQKIHTLSGEGEPPADNTVPTVQKPYGRLSNVICSDADWRPGMFPPDKICLSCPHSLKRGQTTLHSIPFSVARYLAGNAASHG